MTNSVRGALSLGLLLAAGLIGLILWSNNVGDDSISALAIAVGPAFPFASRPSGGFRPPRETTRSSGSPEALSPDARIAVARIEKRAGAEPTPTTLAALGLGYLVQGDADRAISTLEGLAYADSADTWNNLSAAYLAKAERSADRRVELFARAIDAASKSLALRVTNEAMFNRGLALDGLAPYVGATDVWSPIIAAERDPEWLRVAERRRDRARRAADVLDRWRSARNELRAALASRDAVTVGRIVRDWPEGAIDVLDREVLVEWARSNGTIDFARILAEAIFIVTGDSVQLDEVQLLRRRGTALAKAHLDYAEGLRLYDTDDFARAQDAFARARRAFQSSQSPYWLWASLGEATIGFLNRRLNDTAPQLTRIAESASATGHRTIVGRALWVRGLAFQKQWRPSEALADFRAALKLFDDAQQREHAVNLNGHIADALRTLGERQESWHYIGRTLEGLDHVRRPIRRYVMLYSASLFASTQELWPASLVFQNAALETARTIGSGPVIEGLTQRAAIFNRQGDAASAEADLAEARALIEREPAGIRRQWAEAEHAMIAAEVERYRRPNDALSHLNKAFEFFSNAEPSLAPRLQLSIGRVQRQRGDVTAAATAFRQGIEKLELQQASLDEDAFRVSYFDDSWNLFPEMIDLQLSQLRDDRASFEYAERSRGRALLSTTTGADRPLDLAAIQSVVPPSTALVYYVTLSDRLVIWTITAHEAVRFIRPVLATEVSRLVAAYRLEIDQRPDEHAAAERLFEAILQPVAPRLPDGFTVVFVPDGDLQRVAFAALRNPTTGRYFVEEHASAVTPSASFFAVALDRLRATSDAPLTAALLVGASSLTGAEAEATAASRFYRERTVLTGAAATASRFVELAPTYDVVHFGGHAYVNAEYPLLSRLSFADSRDREDTLFAYQISRLPLHRTRVVVLAACSTAVGSLSRGEGVMSIARPFLAAGVPTVVGSQWDVDDAKTSRLFVEFHKVLSEHGSPVHALRVAQLAMLRGGDRATARPASWAGFVVLGTTAR